MLKTLTSPDIRSSLSFNLSNSRAFHLISPGHCLGVLFSNCILISIVVRDTSLSKLSPWSYNTFSSPGIGSSLSWYSSSSKGFKTSSLIHGELVLGRDGSWISIIVRNLSLRKLSPWCHRTFASPDIGGSLSLNLSNSRGFPLGCLIGGELMLCSDGSWISIIVWNLSLWKFSPWSYNTLTSPGIRFLLFLNSSNSGGFPFSGLISGELMLGLNSSWVSIIVWNFLWHLGVDLPWGTIISPDILSSEVLEVHSSGRIQTSSIFTSEICFVERT